MLKYMLLQEWAQIPLFIFERRSVILSKNIKNTVAGIIKPIITEMGYEYVETDFSKQGRDFILTVYIDSDAGITIDDCERVSRTIEPVLDEHDPIEQSYCLCVSSLGLDRPLKNSKDFEKAIGTCIDIKLYKNINGQKLYSGRLVEYSDCDITIEDADGTVIKLELHDIAKITSHIDF